MRRLKAFLAFFSAMALVVGVFTEFMIPGVSYAAAMNSLSLTLQDGTSSGGSAPGGTVNHLFSFTIPSTTTIHSIQFLYCTTQDGTCIEPTGLVTAGASLGAQTGLSFDSLVANPSGTPAGTEGAPYLKSTAGVTPTANDPVSFQLLNVVNPSTTNYTFHVRITTYTTTSPNPSDIVDTGYVTASTAQAISLSGIMPESLVFCTGGQINPTSGIPDCTTATSGSIAFNADFSPTATAYAQSQMAASTNATSGYSITVDGPTLTSGSNTISAIGSTASASILGVPQFGINLEPNTTPGVGAAVSLASDGVNYFGFPVSPFSTANSFAFTADAGATINLNVIANSSNGGGSSLPTDAQIYTISYIVNVPGRQPAGTYTTTLTYICTATF
jgi:hypothetical protein